MKANEANKAPEKIYFTSNENGTHYYTEGIPFEREYVEYVCKDVFIKKACVNYPQTKDLRALDVE